MSLKITDWAVEDRPRERLWTKGPSSLSDAELLGILIGSGTRNRSAVDLAHELLALAGNSLTELGRLSAGEIRKIRGLGDAKAVIISAALELDGDERWRRRLKTRRYARRQMSSTSSAPSWKTCRMRNSGSCSSTGPTGSRTNENKPGRGQRHCDGCAHSH